MKNGRLERPQEVRPVGNEVEGTGIKACRKSRVFNAPESDALKEIFLAEAPKMPSVGTLRCSRQVSFVIKRAMVNRLLFTYYRFSS